MTREEQVKFCSVCKNRSFDPKTGIVCGLTNEKATFEIDCPDFNEDEKEKVIQEGQVQSKKEDSNKSINKGRITLFIIGGLYVLIGFYEAFIIDYHALEFGIADWGIAAIFIGLGVWSYKNPFIALIIGLAIYVILILLFTAIDPASFFKGILWKGLILYYLISSIKTAHTEAGKVKASQSDLLDDF